MPRVNRNDIVSAMLYAQSHPELGPAECVMAHKLLTIIRDGHQKDAGFHERQIFDCDKDIEMVGKQLSEADVPELREDNDSA